MTPVTNPEDLTKSDPTISLIVALLMLLGVFLGAIAAVFVMPVLLPSLTSSLIGADPKAYWELSRSSAVVAYLLLWLSMVFGLLITNRFARLWPGGPAALDLHQFVSLLALGFTIFHAVILLGDKYIGYTALQIAIPFTNWDYRPLWVGIGQVAFYLLLPVTFSFYFRKYIGINLWRWIHLGSFVAYSFITVHGLLAGSDTTTPVMLGIYALTGALAYLMTTYRILTMAFAQA